MTIKNTSLILFASGLLMTGCKTTDVAKKDEPKPPTNAQMSEGSRPFGIVEQVKKSENFVIISATGPVPDENVPLCTRNFAADETSRLRLSPERKSTLLTADIVSGEPNPGDMVFVHRSMGDDTSPSATTNQPIAKKSSANTPTTKSKKSATGTNPIGPDRSPEPLSPTEKIPEPPVELGPDPSINANQMPDVPR